jgi:SPP1 gp7 family putative phage head morphogenesis protein
MCNSCINNNSVVSSYQSNQYDPTRTTTLRNAFAREMRVRFGTVERLVKDAIVEKDALGLNQVVVQRAAHPREFDFPTSEKKVEAFMRWIQHLIDTEVLSVSRFSQIGTPYNQRWTDLYVEDSYKRGLLRARYEIRKNNPNIPSIDDSGGVQAMMNTPFHMDRVGLLFVRVYEDLKGISQQMAMQISRVLSQGMIDGDNPRLIARKLAKTISGMGEDLGITDTLGRYIPAKRRAEMLARTEIIRAHHKAMIQEYRNWGVEGVSVLAEFRTAGDKRVCDICGSMQGNVYSLDEADGIIPVHPMCRCIVMPFEIPQGKTINDYK